MSLQVKAGRLARPLLCVILMLPLVGCVKSLPIKPENKNIVVNYQPDLPTNRIAGKSTMRIGTVGKENDKAIEVASRCNLTSDELHLASFETPATLVVPRFVQSGKFNERGKPAHVRLECRYGEHFVVKTVTATDKKVQTATNAGIAGAILTTVVSAALASTTPWQLPQSVSLDYGDLSARPVQPAQASGASTNDSAELEKPAG